MEYTRLGRTGLYISRLCLGTMNFGCSTPEKEAFKIMDGALEAGINFFDTANNYGFLTGDLGITEEIMGRWFAQGNGRRERTVLATKVHEAMKDPYDGANDTPGLSIYKIRRHLEASLRRLQTDHIEVYYMHHIDRNVTWDETWDVFQNLFEKGVIDYVGASNFPAWELARAQGEAKKRNFLGIAIEQDRYSLVSRMPELEVLPACEALGIGFVAWAPLGGGVLAGPAKDSVRRVGLGGDIQGKVDAFQKICQEAGLREADAALAWTLENKTLTAPIIGVRTLAQLEDSLRVMEVKLPQDVMAEFDKIFPGPGIAPEAYAW